MMKKINNIKQLQAEKARIKKHGGELEEKISDNWKDLKESLRPANIARQTFNSIISNRINKNLAEDSVLKNSLNYGMSMLVKRFVDKAEKKVSHFFGK